MQRGPRNELRRSTASCLWEGTARQGRGELGEAVQHWPEPQQHWVVRSWPPLLLHSFISWIQGLRDFPSPHPTPDHSPGRGDLWYLSQRTLRSIALLMGAVPASSLRGQGSWCSAFTGTMQ